MLLCVTVWTKSVCWLGLCQVCIQIIWGIIICPWFSGNCAVIQKHVQCKLLLYAQPVLFTLSVSFCVCHMRWREAMGTNKDAFQWEASHHIMLHAMCTPLKTHSSVRIWMYVCVCVCQFAQGEPSRHTGSDIVYRRADSIPKKLTHHGIQAGPRVYKLRLKQKGGNSRAEGG